MANSHETWSKNAVIYEVNIRQFTEEGTFRAFEKHLPRLKNMGIDIVWLMPIQPIGVKNRKGSMGSHYSIKDYLNVNPDYGTMSDFKHLVKECHKNNMKIIIDWVANHTAWDNNLITEHEDWYTHNEKGEIVPPVADWSDVADLNYDKPELKAYMTDALKFWIQQCDIDGYRCDVADMVPTSFWLAAKPELDKIGKPIFMLAEAENVELHPNAFDANYAWEIHHIMNEIAQEKKTVKDLDNYFTTGGGKKFGAEVYRMSFTSNHDENSWNGTEFERLKSIEAVRCMGVLAATVPGMLLIYNGQEDSLTRRLKFFDKDYIGWGHYPLAAYYKTLIDLKHRNPALWNGIYGGELKRIKTSQDDAIFAFSRSKDGHNVVVMCNLSKESHDFMIEVPGVKGKMSEIFSLEETELDSPQPFKLAPYGYKVFAN
jgi:glycosidase